MAAFVYHPALEKIMDGTIDFDTNDMRVALVMTNTTADTEVDTTLMNGFGTLDECDGANYVRKAIGNEAVNFDSGNDRAEFDGDDITWTALGNGTRQIQGYIVFKFVTDDSDSIPVIYRDFAATINPGGNDLQVAWNAEGILQLANA